MDDLGPSAEPPDKERDSHPAPGTQPTAERAEGENHPVSSAASPDETEPTSDTDEARSQQTTSSDPSQTDLTEAELKEVSDLEARDQEVRSHEQAHKAAAGAHAGPIQYDFQHGPDGRRYAVGGEVSVDLSAVEGDPSATVAKMQQLRRAALAPADPSPADRAAAAQAAQVERRAHARATHERSSETEEGASSTERTENPAPDEVTQPELSTRSAPATMSDDSPDRAEPSPAEAVPTPRVDPYGDRALAPQAAPVGPARLDIFA